MVFWRERKSGAREYHTLSPAARHQPWARERARRGGTHQVKERHRYEVPLGQSGAMSHRITQAYGRHLEQVAVLLAMMLLWSWLSAWSGEVEHGEAQRGQRLYGYYCAVCHGLEGTGTGRNAAYLQQMGRGPRDHTDMWYMNRLSDDELYRAISEGKLRAGEPPFMPWWGHTLTGRDIWDLVAFIRTLAKEEAE